MDDAVFEDFFGSASDTPALTTDSVRWTRRDLARAAASVAVELGRRGVDPGDTVVVLAESTAPMVAALLGARARGAFVYVIDPQLADAIVPTMKGVVLSSGGTYPGSLDVTTLLSTSTRGRPVIGSERAWGVRTSGTSSGRARIVAIGVESVASILETIPPILGYREGDVVVSSLPLHHVYGLSQLWFCLNARAELVLSPASQLPGDRLRWIRSATVLPAIPKTVRSILAAGPFPRLRLVTLAGQSTVPEERKRFTAALPNTSFLQFYGLTEAFRVLWLPAHEFDSGDDTGRPVPGSRAWLEDGELYVESPNVALGYVDDPEGTRHTFPAPSVVRTGDSFERRGDVFRYLGRRDGVFKSMGEKVIPEAVEREILALAGVEQCLVTPEIIGGEELRPVARIVAPEGSLTQGRLLAELRKRLPSWMVPARVVFVEQLPTTASGKVLRRAPP